MKPVIHGLVSVAEVDLLICSSCWHLPLLSDYNCWPRIHAHWSPHSTSRYVLFSPTDMLLGSVVALPANDVEPLLLSSFSFIRLLLQLLDLNGLMPASSC